MSQAQVGGKGKVDDTECILFLKILATQFFSFFLQKIEYLCFSLDQSMIIALPSLMLILILMMIDFLNLCFSQDIQVANILKPKFEIPWGCKEK